MTELFIKNGFDVKKNNCKNGKSCLHALCYSSDDHYILHAAELLFRAGYIKDTDVDDKSGVLDSISWRFGDWYTGEYDSANIFVAYYILVQRAFDGRKYLGIRAFRDCVGKTVLKVERIKKKGVRRDEVRTSYLLHCEDMHLVVSDYVEFIINPYAREEAIEIEDVSDKYCDIIGAKIRGLRYLNSTLAKLSFDNGYAVQVGNVCFDENERTWFRVVSNGLKKLPSIGTTVESIKLWGQIIHSENSEYYREKTIVLNAEKCAYALYANGKNYKDASIRVEVLDKDLSADITRQIEAKNLILQHVEYNGDVIKWIKCSCDEGILYIVSEGHPDVAVFMSAFEIEPDEIRYIGFHTKGLKKIAMNADVVKDDNFKYLNC